MFELKNVCRRSGVPLHLESCGTERKETSRTCESDPNPPPAAAANQHANL